MGQSTLTGVGASTQKMRTSIAKAPVPQAVGNCAVLIPGGFHVVLLYSALNLQDSRDAQRTGSDGLSLDYYRKGRDRCEDNKAQTDDKLLPGNVNEDDRTYQVLVCNTRYEVCIDCGSSTTTHR